MRASRLMLFFSCCLVLLHGVDFLLTWVLIESGIRPDVYEANPVANLVLARQGWLGLAGFKAFCGAIGLGAGLLASVRRPAVGLRLLAAECVLMSAVVGYSAILLQRPSSEESERRSQQMRASELGVKFEQVARFAAARTVICHEVLQGRATLTAGVERMGTVLVEFAPRLTKAQRERLPDARSAGQVAAYLYHHCSRLAVDEALPVSNVDRLGREVARLHPAAPLYRHGLQAPGIEPNWSKRTEEHGRSSFGAGGGAGGVGVRSGARVRWLPGPPPGGA